MPSPQALGASLDIFERMRGQRVTVTSLIIGDRRAPVPPDDRAPQDRKGRLDPAPLRIVPFRSLDFSRGRYLNHEPGGHPSLADEYAHRR
jgi:hypothetical protein